MNPITILLVDDEMLVRQALRPLLSKEPDFEIVGEAGNGRDAIEMAKRLSPDVILLDCAMPILNGLAAAFQMRDLGLASRILFLTRYQDETYIRQALKSGAHGYLFKQEPYSVVAQGIRLVRDGKHAFSMSVTQILLAHIQGGGRMKAPPVEGQTPLTIREREVLQLIAESKTCQDIALMTGLSKKSVARHRQTIVRKTGAVSDADLTRYAVKMGLVRIDRF